MAAAGPATARVQDVPRQGLLLLHGFPERCIVYGYVLEGRGPVGALEQLVPTSPTVNILIIGMLATAPGDLRLGKGQCGQWKKNALGEPAHAPKR